MEEQIYIVTLYKSEDLEQFYNDMERNGFKLSLKRPISRNTHYWMTEDQAKELRQDPRIWEVTLLTELKDAPSAIVNNTPYTLNGVFWKADSIAPIELGSSDFQWGHLHCAGTEVQRRKGTWGYSGGSENENIIESVTDTVQIYNDGKHVDVVIVDNTVSKECEEWYSPTTNQTRFVEYQWFNELNSYINSENLDDDFTTLPTGYIEYHTNASNPSFHGNHVTGTVAGQYYGWAREANIYSMSGVEGVPYVSGQVVPATLRFDYLRAFHRTKPINPETGKRNPTISNHSYGGVIEIPDGNLTIDKIEYIIWRDNTYNSLNAGPSGWTEDGVQNDFGIRFGISNYPSYYVPIVSDVLQAIEDGIVVIGSAGNDHLMLANGPTDQDWNNQIKLIDGPLIYYNRGAWPNTPDSGSIVVGALGYFRNFYQATFSNYGPGVDIFAPGENIISTFNNTGLSDPKYSEGNYIYPINGTSMASPQVAGAIALAASGKNRFTQSDATKYLKDTQISDELTFNFGINLNLSEAEEAGSFLDFTAQKGSPNLTLAVKNTRPASGQIEEIKGERKVSGQVYPRQPRLYG